MGQIFISTGCTLYIAGQEPEPLRRLSFSAPALAEKPEPVMPIGTLCCEIATYTRHSGLGAILHRAWLDAWAGPSKGTRRARRRWRGRLKGWGL